MLLFTPLMPIHTLFEMCKKRGISKGSCYRKNMASIKVYIEAQSKRKPTLNLPQLLYSVVSLA